MRISLFEPVLPGIRTCSRLRWIDAETGNLHRLVVTVARGAGLPLVWSQCSERSRARHPASGQPSPPPIDNLLHQRA